MIIAQCDRGDNCVPLQREGGRKVVVLLGVCVRVQLQVSMLGSGRMLETEAVCVCAVSYTHLTLPTRRTV